MTRVAVGCSDYAALDERIHTNSIDGQIRFATRFRPKRADELVGGKLHFIVRHMIVGRVEIMRFNERADGRTDIICKAELERVRPVPKRAHQGWRYLAECDAPASLGYKDGIDEMPADLYRALAQLSLI